ncbi:MAG: hypothetical protein NTU79_01135 [Planctomycetota bacterium]|nr:hypothetical protein [Planctomycetota bacterium]
MSLLQLNVKVQFNSKSVEQKVQKANFRSLGHAGGAIRKTAARSIRRGKKPSKPGEAPHTPTGHLKRVIRYEVDERQSEVVIGPANEYSRTIWNLHEFGGTVRPKARLLKAHKFQVGEYGPIRRSGAMQRDKRGRFARRGKTFARVKLLTEAQANRATRIVNSENAMRIADSKKPRTYPKRPFMGPALDKLRDRLPKFWANSVNQ